MLHPTNLPDDLDPWLTLATTFAPILLPHLGAVGQGYLVRPLSCLLSCYSWLPAPHCIGNSQPSLLLDSYGGNLMSDM